MAPILEALSSQVSLNRRGVGDEGDDPHSSPTFGTHVDLEFERSIVARYSRWSRDHLGSPVYIEDTTVTAWEDNSYDDGEEIALP
jgi:hypothetical protein